MKILLSTLLITFVFAAWGQSYDLREAIDFFRNYQLQTGENKTTLTETNIEGSPYLNDEFVTGTIFTYQNIEYQGIPLRYNAYSRQLEFKTPDGQVLALSAPEIVERAELGETILSYIPYRTGKRVDKSFFILLHTGKVSLYARPEVEFIEAKEAAAYKDPEPPKFEKRPDSYYLRIAQDAAVKIENKKQLIGFLPDHHEHIEAFIKKNKIKTSKKEKLIELIDYYNSL